MPRLPAYRVYLGYGALTALFVNLIDPIVAVYYVRVVGLNPLELVLLGTVVQVASLVFEIPTGVVADLYSRRLSVILGVLLVGTSFVIQGLVPILAIIAGAEVLRGIGSTFTSGALEAWIADEIGDRAAQPAFARYAQVRQVFAVVGTICGAAIATVSLGLPIVLGGGLLVGLGFGLTVVMPERGFQRDHGGVHPGLGGLLSTARAGLDAIRVSSVLPRLMALALAFGLATEGLDRLWEAHLLANVAFPAIAGVDSVLWFGIINVGFMALSVVTTEVARRYLAARGPDAAPRALLAISVVRVVGVVTFGLATDFWLAVGAYLVTESFRRASQPIFTAWLARATQPRQRATIFSIAGQVDSIGQLSGGPLLGLIGTAMSLRVAMVAAGALLAPAIPILLATKRTDRDVSGGDAAEAGSTDRR